MPEMNRSYTTESTASRSSSPRRTSTSAWPSTWRGATATAAPRGQHQGGRDDGFPPVLERLRGHRAPRPDRQAHRRRLRRHHDHADQPRHHRHRALRAAPDGRAGRDRRRGRDGVPGRVPGRVRGDARPAGHQQDRHADVHLRPPDHPGRAVRGVPAAHARSSCSAKTASTTRSSRRCTSPTSRSAGCATSRSCTRGTSPSPPGSSNSSIPTGSVATSWPTPTRSSTSSAATLTSTSTSTASRCGISTGSSPPAGSAASRSMKLREILGVLRDSYCRTVGIEYMHIQDPEQREWMQERVEQPDGRPDHDEQMHILQGSTWPRPSRRSCRPSTWARSGSRWRAANPSSRSSTRCSPRRRVRLDEVVIGMAHRGRLNVLANIVGKSYGQIFGEFEGRPRPEHRPRFRGREVPPRRRGHLRRRRWQAHRRVPDQQPQPS